MAAVQATLAGTVHSAALDDDRAWEALFDRFTPAIRRAAGGYGLAPHEVDDVVQSCWLSLLGSVDTLRQPEAVGASLVTTARRRALRMRRQVVRELLTEDPLPADLAAPGSIEDAVVQAERASELRKAMRRLPGDQRVLLESMLVPPESSHADVSKDLDMTIGSIGPTRDRGLRRRGRDVRLVAGVGP
jgi:RNA polymerase sigma factor (sigma-70 family)